MVRSVLVILKTCFKRHRAYSNLIHKLMNKKFSIRDNAILSDIVDQIDATLACPKFREFSNQIDIDTWDNI